jgi:hypothetical protein
MSCGLSIIGTVRPVYQQPARLLLFALYFLDHQGRRGRHLVSWAVTLLH